MKTLRKRMASAIALAIVLASTVGCIHKSSGAVTPQERLMTDNALLAQFADTAEQGTELAVTTGLMSTSAARPVITFESQFATVHTQITNLLNQGLTAANLAQVQTLLTNLNTQAAVLVASGNIGIKNPKTQQTITGDINNIIALANAVLVDIQLYEASVAQPVAQSGTGGVN